MVGVPTSTGCLICRKRKIKCDETWPNCLNCRKNRKSCPGPPARHTFKDLGPRLNISAITVLEETLSAPLEQRCRRLTQIHEKYDENGSVLHKFRISDKGPGTRKRLYRSSSASLSPPKSPFLRQPSPSQHQRLAQALMEATTTGNAGHRMSLFGPFIREVPSRIGHNAALDAAVAVLVDAHSSLVRKKLSNEMVSPELYLRAIKTLQTCLDDPQQGMSPNTLCASVLLSLVEALAGPRVGNRYLAHVGGAGRLMELQGPEKYGDPFARELLRFNRGGIIITSVYERRPCFLLSSEWRDIAFDKKGLSFDDCLHTDLMQYMAELPTVFHDFKQLANHYTLPSLDTMDYDLNLHDGLVGPLSDDCSSLEFEADNFGDLGFMNRLQPTENAYPIDRATCAQSSARVALLYKVQNLKDSLRALGVHMNAKLANGRTVFELPAIEENSPVPLAYHFNNWRDMTAYNCFWSMLILTNKSLMRLLQPFDPTIYELQSENRSIALEICKTWEHAWATKPIGAFHTGLSFVVAFEYCNPDVQEWIITRLNSLLDYQMVDAFRWSEDVVAMMSSKLAGQGPDLVFSNVNPVEEMQ